MLEAERWPGIYLKNEKITDEDIKEARRKEQAHFFRDDKSSEVAHIERVT